MRFCDWQQGHLEANVWEGSTSSFNIHFSLLRVTYAYASIYLNEEIGIFSGLLYPQPHFSMITYSRWYFCIIFLCPLHSSYQLRTKFMNINDDVYLQPNADIYADTYKRKILQKDKQRHRHAAKEYRQVYSVKTNKIKKIVIRTHKMPGIAYTDLLY